MNKACFKCGVTKSLDEYPRKSASKDGHRGVCNSCYSEQRKSHVSRLHGYERYGYWWKQFNPKKRAIWKKRNYSQTRKGAVNARDGWTLEQLRQITAEDRPIDRELAMKLGRSVQAIQIARSRAKTILLASNPKEETS